MSARADAMFGQFYGYGSADDNTGFVTYKGSTSLWRVDPPPADIIKKEGRDAWVNQTKEYSAGAVMAFDFVMNKIEETAGKDIADEARLKFSSVRAGQAPQDSSLGGNVYFKRQNMEKIQTFVEEKINNAFTAAKNNAAAAKTEMEKAKDKVIELAVLRQAQGKVLGAFPFVTIKEGKLLALHPIANFDGLATGYENSLRVTATVMRINAGMQAIDKVGDFFTNRNAVPAGKDGVLWRIAGRLLSDPKSEIRARFDLYIEALARQGKPVDDKTVRTLLEDLFVKERDKSFSDLLRKTVVAELEAQRPAKPRPAPGAVRPR
jgi:hypothetical protein